MSNALNSFFRAAPFACVLCAGLALGSTVSAQQAQGGAPASSGAAAAPAPDAPPLSDAELAQLVAPLALYPDSLLSQILMASTYPLEIVQADRWTKENKSLKGDALATALEKQPWDPSVKSLVNFPDVLSGLSDKLDWTVKLGDAFLDDQKRVLDTVQSLRSKAKDAGNLNTTAEQNVTVTQQPGSTTQTIVIESSKPDVVYVPTYDTTVVYGGWPYPTYPPPPPPYYPSYSAGAAVVGFGVGVACGAAWGYAWGNCNWGGGDVNINVNQNANFNNNINRGNYQNRAGQGAWQHDASHRQGAAYRNNATAQRYGGATGARGQGASNQYRGRADAGRQDLAGGGAGAGRGAAGAGSPGAGAGRGAAGAGSPGAGRGAAGAGGGRSSPSAGTRQSSGSRSNAFSGAGGGGGRTREASSRGNASRSSAGMSRGGGGSRGGASRGGGGRGGRRG